ncbi:hypothetical protein BH10ACI2_BH10ACI2_26180 [soil metagenome]
MRNLGLTADDADEADRKDIFSKIMLNEQFLHSDLTQGIIGTFFDVYNELGHGFI